MTEPTQRSAAESVTVDAASALTQAAAILSGEGAIRNWLIIVSDGRAVAHACSDPVAVEGLCAALIGEAEDAEGA